MDIEALENTTFAAIVEKIQKVRKRGELLESIHGILKKNFETVEAEHQIECQKIRNVIEGIPGELIGNTREMREVSKLVRRPHRRNSPYPRQGRHRQGIRRPQHPRALGTQGFPVRSAQLRRSHRRSKLF